MLVLTMSDVTVKFGKLVREQRLAKNWSQEELAAAAQLDRTYIGGVERGERNISLLNIVKIATALEVNPRDLLNFEIG